MDPNSEQAPVEQTGDSPTTLDDYAEKLYPDETDKSEEPTSEDKPEGEEATGDGLEEVEYEGEKYRVPPKLKEAVIRQSDYTRKTQEVSQIRQNVELVQQSLALRQAQSQFDDSVRDETTQLAQIDAYVQAQLARWGELSADDKDMLTPLRLKADQLQRSIEEKRGKFQQEQQAKMADYQGKAMETISKLPGFKPEVLNEVAQYALKTGFSQVEARGLLDPRNFQLAWKAMQYDKLQANKSTAIKQPVVKPGASKPMPADVRAKLDFRKQVKTAKTSSEKARLIQRELERTA